MKLSPVIDIEELLRIIKNNEVMIFDVGNGSNDRLNYEKEHIEGAFYIDLNTELADIKNDLALGGRHPLPEPEKFAIILSNLGITNSTHVIVYDQHNGANAAARFWWMLKSIGHVKVQVLNGGFHWAKKNQVPVSSQFETVKKTSQVYQFQKWKLPLADLNKVEKVSEDPNYIVIDVRAKERYEGKTEPIDLIAGHIPGAVNFPFTENLNSDGLFHSPEQLSKKFSILFGDIKPENRIIHCGSGVTACHMLLAIDYAEMDIPALYVGSWSEWSRNNKKMVN